MLACFSVQITSASGCNLVVWWGQYRLLFAIRVLIDNSKTPFVFVHCRCLCVHTQQEFGYQGCPNDGNTYVSMAPPYYNASSALGKTPDGPVEFSTLPSLGWDVPKRTDGTPYRPDPSTDSNPISYIPVDFYSVIVSC